MPLHSKFFTTASVFIALRRDESLESISLYTSLDRFFTLLKSTKRICSQDDCTAPDRYRGTAYERLTKDRQRADPRQ